MKPGDKGRARRRKNAGRTGSRPAILFLLRFLALWLGALLIVSWVPGIEGWAIHNTAAALGAILSWFAADAQVVEPAVSAFGVHFAIVPDCTPLMPVVLFSAACLAFPASARLKLAGLVIGTALLWTYNQVRLLALFAVMKRWPGAFDFLHLYLWQTVTLAVVFLLFVGWLHLPSLTRGRLASIAAVTTPVAGS